MKKALVLLFSFILLIATAACGSDKGGGSADSGAKKTVKVGTTSAEVPIWNLIKKKAAKEGINIKIVRFDDYVQPNLALADGDIDLNAFQTIVYFNDFKKKHHLDLAAIGTTNIWPMGIYSKKVKDIKDIKDGDQIVIPNDSTNLGRALLLMQKAGLIKLKDGFTVSNGLDGIASNPKHLKITTVNAAQTPRSLDDATAAIINCDMAINAGLNPTNDPIFREDASNVDYINIIAAKTKDKNNKTYKKIVDIYHTKEVADFIKKHYKGAAIPVNRPIDEITK